MILSQKSTNFAKKILQYNPIVQKNHISSCNKHCSHDHSENIDKKSQNQPQIKPFLHVHDHRKERQIYQKPTKEKLENMKTFKEQGNQHFKNKRFQQAAYFYNKVIIFGDYTFPEHQKEQKLMDELLQQANCNLGLTFIKMNEHRKSQASLIQAVKGPIQKLIHKANYWLVKVYIEIGEFDKAVNKIDQLSKNQENKNQISQLEVELVKVKLKYEQKSKNVYSQMFSN